MGRKESNQRKNKLFDTLIVFWKEFFEKVNFEKSQQMTTEAWKISKHAER